MRLIIDRDVPVEMRDGTVLRADVYRPDSDDTWPVLLQRTPYDKADDSLRYLVRCGYRLHGQTRGCASQGAYLMSTHGIQRDPCCVFPAAGKTVTKDLFELKSVADGVYAAIAAPQYKITTCRSLGKRTCGSMLADRTFKPIGAVKHLVPGEACDGYRLANLILGLLFGTLETAVPHALDDLIGETGRLLLGVPDLLAGVVDRGNPTR